MLRRFLLATLLVLMAANAAADGMQYHQVRIWLDGTPPGTLQALGVDFEGSRQKGDLFIDLILSESELATVEQTGYTTEILQTDMTSFYQQSLSNAIRPWGMGSMGGYYTYDEVVANMDSMQAAYPELVSARDSLGASLEDRAIWAFRISNSPDFPEDEPEVFFNSLIHAREPASMMTLLYYAWYLLEHYDTDPFVQFLVDHRQIWFVPVVNPDGYVFNEINDPQGGGMHRKNLRTGLCFGNPGIDLNRNWGYMWGYDDVGSSSDPCSQTYRGSAAFSEPETQVLRDFVLAHDFGAVFNTHTYGDLLIRPFGYDESVPIPEPDSSIYVELGHDLVQENGYLFGTGSETVMYTVNGDAVDYMYGELGILNFTPEIGHSFWPPSDAILDLALENVPMLLHLTDIVGNALYLADPIIDGDGGTTQWETYAMDLEIRNKGLDAADAAMTFDINLSSPNGSLGEFMDPITGMSAPPPQHSLHVEQGFTVLAAPSEEAQLLIELTIHSAGDSYSRMDTLFWRIGVPDTLFSDDFENDLSLWVSTDWGLTTDGYQGTQSAADSPHGWYANESTTTLILAEPIDLSTVIAPRLRYDLSWEIESGWDFAQIEASCDGGSVWQPLAGLYTTAGSGNGVQPLGEPGYDGTHDWVGEDIDLSAYTGCTSLLIRFALASDTYITGDGLLVDNVVLLGWPAALPGDLDGDDQVTIADVILAIEWSLGTPPGPDQVAVGDLNGDSVVNILDIVAILELIL